MEENKATKDQTSRFNCENALCKRDRKYFCKDHKTVLCMTCYTALHLECCIYEITDKKHVQECINYIRNLLNTIMANSEVFNANRYIKDFDFEVKRYWDSLMAIELKFLNVVEKDEFLELEAKMKEAIQFQKDFKGSQLFTEYSKYITLLVATNSGGFDPSIKEQCTNIQQLKEYKERITKEVEDNKQRILVQKLKEEKEILVNENKDRIKQLEDKIVEETKIKVELTEKTKKLNADIEKQAEELKTEIKNANDLYEKEKDNSNAKDQIMKDCNTCMLSNIYFKHFKSKISDPKTCSLDFDYSGSKPKAFCKELESAKLRLPNAKRIVIDSISDSDADLNSFLSNCAPDCLEKFSLNRCHASYSGVKTDFYIEAFSKAFKAVTKEIYVECLQLTASNLEQMIKASSNSERLVIRYSDVSCSTALDFTIEEKYNTKFLSFFNCGRNSFRKSDFKSNPSLFENIVEAIGKSGLKDSLQTIDIKGCGLSKTTVQELFTKHGISTVQVVEIGD